MKMRRNVMVDDELLNKAREVTGEQTYSGAIEKALREVTREHEFREKLRKWQELAWADGAFHPAFVNEKMANSLSQPPKRLSAHETRAPRKKSRRRASR
jgi:Arc/MetJ family transcription regulator